MNTWVDHPGYPVINVIRKYDEKKEVEITQKRFFDDTSLESNINIIHNWHVPISYATPSDVNFTDTKPQIWLKESKKTEVIDVGPNEWILLNKKQTGKFIKAVQILLWNRKKKTEFQVNFLFRFLQSQLRHE